MGEARADLMSLNRHFMEHGHWGNPLPELTLTPQKMTMNLDSDY
jgi:hypothetical protein